MVDAAGSSLTFGLFALFCVIGWIWIFLQVPETKGRSLEEIERDLAVDPGAVESVPVRH